MPLSKAKQAEYQKKRRLGMTQPTIIPKSTPRPPKSVQPVIPKTLDAKTFGYATKDVPAPAWMKKPI